MHILLFYMATIRYQCVQRFSFNSKMTNKSRLTKKNQSSMQNIFDSFVVKLVIARV